MFSGGDRRRDGNLEYVSSSVQRCVQDWLWAHLHDLTAAEVWTEEELDIHMNILEMKAVQLALAIFRDWILDFGGACGLDE